MIVEDAPEGVFNDGNRARIRVDPNPEVVVLEEEIEDLFEEAAMIADRNIH